MGFVWWFWPFPACAAGTFILDSKVGRVEGRTYRDVEKGTTTLGVVISIPKRCNTPPRRCWRAIRPVAGFTQVVKSIEMTKRTWSGQLRFLGLFSVLWK
jgi:hypothetical protein